jgi:hypothetical protein
MRQRKDFLPQALEFYTGSEQLVYSLFTTEELNVSVVRVRRLRRFARRMRSGYGGMNSAANVEIADHRHLTRTTCGNQIIENPVDDGFVESALIAKGPEIEFERLQLDTELVRDIFDFDGRKIGLPGARAHTGEFRTLHVDLIIALRPRVRKGFQLCARSSRHLGIVHCRKTVSKLAS